MNYTIQRLWDELADFSADQSEAALKHLMSCLCSLVNAQNASWIGCVRLPDIVNGDSVHGWRPRAVRFLHQPVEIEQAIHEQREQLELPEPDAVVVSTLAEVGTFRVRRLAEMVPADWFSGPQYHRYYLGVGHADAIMSGTPINADAEVYIALYRDSEHPRFSPEERDTLAMVLRPLRWFHRKQLLSQGVLMASSALTPTESKVLHELLSGRAEKEIALSLKQSPNTTHVHVTAIYRKFGVSTRSALMALWLGKSA